MSVSRVFPVVLLDVLAVDDIGEREDDVSAQLDVDVFWREARDTGALLRRAAIVTEQCPRRCSLLRLLLLLIVVITRSH